MAENAQTITGPTEEDLERDDPGLAGTSGQQPAIAHQDLGNQPDRNDITGDEIQQGTLDVYQTDKGGAAEPAT